MAKSHGLIYFFLSFTREGQHEKACRKWKSCNLKELTEQKSEKNSSPEKWLSPTDWYLYLLVNIFHKQGQGQGQGEGMKKRAESEKAQLQNWNLKELTAVRT